MLWYVAFVAAINLALGYVWGAHFRKCPRCAKARAMGLSLLDPSTHATNPAAIASGEVPVDEVPAVAPTAPTTPPAADAEAPAEVAADATDPETGLVTRDRAESLLGELAGNGSGEPVTAGLVELAPIDSIGGDPPADIPLRLLTGVSQVVQKSIASGHTLARFTDQQFLLLIPQEDVEQVTKRAEELRQRIAVTEFVADGRSYQTTVTCALADVGTHGTGPKLFEFLQEALDEAKRYGGNRTFMHDGKSPTPVVPAELAISPQQLAI
jgi:GGDEF domain-containing protein